MITNTLNCVQFYTFKSSKQSFNKIDKDFARKRAFKDIQFLVNISNIRKIEKTKNQ